MFKLKLRKLMNIDEYQAIELLDYNTYEGQRPLKAKHLKMLKEEMIKGNFLDGNIALAILKYDNDRKIMVNGQHQCHAIVQTGVTIVVNYQEYEVHSLDDLSELFRRFDNHQQRSLSDCLNPEAVALGVDWKRKIVRVVISAACLSANTKDMPKIEKVNLLKKYLKHGGFINYILNGRKAAKHMFRSAVVLAMMETWEKDKNIAETFWAKVRDGDNLQINDPALKLRNYLMGCVVGSAHNRSTIAPDNIVSVREMYVRCIHAWNASKKGVNTTLKYVSAAQIPKIL